MRWLLSLIYHIGCYVDVRHSNAKHQWSIRFSNLVPKQFSLVYRKYAVILEITRVFSRCFRDPIRVPRIRENYHRVSRIGENRVPAGPHRLPYISFKKNTEITTKNIKLRTIVKTTQICNRNIPLNRCKKVLTWKCEYIVFQSSQRKEQPKTKKKAIQFCLLHLMFTKVKCFWPRILQHSG